MLPVLIKDDPLDDDVNAQRINAKRIAHNHYW